MESITTFFASIFMGVLTFLGMSAYSPNVATTIPVTFVIVASTTNSLSTNSSIVIDSTELDLVKKNTNGTTSQAGSFSVMQNEKKVMKRDKSNDVIVSVTNPKCFGRIGGMEDRFGYRIVINENRIFVENTLFEGADARSFTCIGYVNAFGDGGGFWQSFYFKDKNKVYLVELSSEDSEDPEYSSLVRFDEIKGSDTKTFTYVGQPLLTDQEREISWRTSADSYAKDAYHVYSGSYLLPDFDPVTFENLKSGYIKDKSHVGIFGVGSGPVKAADASSFTVLGNGYAKDKKSIYYYGNVVDGADVDTFFVNEKVRNDYSNFAKDKNYTYENGERSISKQ